MYMIFSKFLVHPNWVNTRTMKCQLFFNDVATNRKHLFKEALKVAKHGKVLFIRNEEFKELPDLSEHLNVNRHYMKMISFLYVKTVDALLEGLAGLPYWQNVPLAIILDQLDQFCLNKNIQQACGIVAFLKDTARACSIALKKECNVYISIDKNLMGDDYCCLLRELYCSQ